MLRSQDKRLDLITKTVVGIDSQNNLLKNALGSLSWTGRSNRELKVCLEQTL